MYGSLDFETYYEKQDGYSLRGMGSWEYCFHPKFDPYLVAYHDERGTVVSPLDGFDWELLRGRTVFMHNANFDAVVLLALVRMGRCPEWIASRETWDVHLPIIDTSDITAWNRVERSLASACKYLLGIKIDKGPRDMMKGLHWNPPRNDQDLALHRDSLPAEKRHEFKWLMPTDEQRQVFLRYAGVDAETTYQLGMKYLPQWPQHEQRLSAWQREAGFRGVFVDQPYLKQCIDKLRVVRFEAGKLIPWNWGPGTSKATPLDLRAARQECLKAGIPAPVSFAKDNLDTQKWEDDFGERLPWVAALRDWRRSNSYLQKFETIARRVRADGTVPYAMRYCGAHTGRPAADSGMNMLNLERKPKFDCDIRRVFRARPGHKLCIMDQSQIEPRCLALLCGNNAFLELLRQGQDPYEAHARLTMGWTGGNLKDASKHDKEAMRLRDTSKGRCLAGETLVRVETGYTPIRSLENTSCLWVWDGRDWVVSEGAAHTADARYLVEVNGERFTPEHELFVTESLVRPAGICAETRPEAPGLLPVSPWYDVWLLAGAVLAHHPDRERRPGLRTLYSLWQKVHAYFQRRAAHQAVRKV